MKIERESTHPGKKKSTVQLDPIATVNKLGEGKACGANTSSISLMLLQLSLLRLQCWKNSEATVSLKATPEQSNN